MIIHTARKSDTWFVPDPSQQPFGAYQKAGPHPAAAASGDPEEYLNADDDRMKPLAMQWLHAREEAIEVRRAADLDLDLDLRG